MSDAEVLLVELQARLAPFEKQLLQAANKSDAALARIEKKFAGSQKLLNKGLQFNSGSLSKGLDNARRSMEGFATQVPVVGGALGALGVGGVAAAAGVMALVMALGQARQAMAFADEISDAAAKTHLGVEALQEYRLAILGAGGDMKDADAAAEGFDSALGKLINRSRGFKNVAAAFRDLGFTDAQIAEIQTFDDFMRLAPDKFAAIGSAAQRANIADRLGVRPLLPLLEQGSQHLEEFTARMREMGVVMDAETVVAMGKAHDEAELLSKVIDLQLKMAFVDLAPVILAAMRAAAEWARGIREFAEDVGPAAEAIGDIIKLISELAGMKVSLNIDSASLDVLEARVASLLRLVGQFDPATRALSNRYDARLAAKNDPLRGMEYDGARAGALGGPDAPARPAADAGSGSSRSRGGSKPKGPSPADIQRAEAARSQRLADEIYRTREQQLEAEKGLYRSLQERQGIEHDALDREHAHELKSLENDRNEALADNDRQMAAEGLTAAARAQLEIARAAIVAQYDELEEVTKRKHAAEQRNATDKEFHDLAEQEVRQLGELDRLRAQVLAAQSASANTWQERRRIEEELLELQLKELRAAMERKMEEEHWDEARRKRARAEMDAYAVAAGDALQQQTAGPLEQFGKDAEFTTDKLEELAVDGLGQLSDAITGLITGTKSASEAIREIWGSMLQAIIKMLVDEMVAKPAADWLGTVISGLTGFGSPGGTSGGGGGGMARGGRPPVGRITKVGEFGAEPFVPDVPGTIIPNNMMRAIEALNPGALAAGGAGGSMSLSMPIVINAQGAGPRELDLLRGELRQLRSELPGKVKGIMQVALDRRQVRARAN